MYKIFPLILFFLFSTIAIHAQSKHEKEVAAAIEALYKAMNEADRNMLEKLAADGLSYGHLPGRQLKYK